MTNSAENDCPCGRGPGHVRIKAAGCTPSAENDRYGFLSSDGYPEEGPNPLIKPPPSAENGACPASVTYTPVDGETGNPLPEHTARCVSPPGHIGLHMGDDRMPFGPPVKRPIPPGSGDTDA